MRMDPKITPAMRQYLDMKRRYPEEILFFRMGDFYEMFFEDAHTASRILDIALTSRQNDIPMCGIPYHAAESYIARLLKAGKRVAVCEQMENIPSSGSVVKREVVRIITPGTVVEDALLTSDENSFLASVVVEKDTLGVAFVDVSTGDFFFTITDVSLDGFRALLMKYHPREAVLYTGDLPDGEAFAEVIRSRGIPVCRMHEWLYDGEYLANAIAEAYKTAGTSGLGLSSQIEIRTVGSAVQYLRDTHRKALEHLKTPRRIETGTVMLLDEATITNLEIVRNLQDGTRDRTLFSVLDRTSTSMGRRFLEQALFQPLLEQAAIETRLDTVQYFLEYQDLSKRIVGLLKGIQDVERILARFSLGRIIPRAFIALKNSFKAAMSIRELLAAQPHERMQFLASSIPDLSAIVSRIETTIEDEPAISPEHGRVIRKGFSEELDRIYNLKTNAKNWILEYEAEERSRLGLPSLKIRYNKIIGYYIEVSKAQAASMPESYFRKQTLVGSERFTTERLQQFESEILSASETIARMENDEIEKLRLEIISKKQDIQDMAAAVADIDLCVSFAVAAMEQRFTRPSFNDRGIISIHEGRHPVVEKYYTREVFVPNDVHLDGESEMIAVITGPNMSGKSTYIRMAAIIQLMAQAGSFVPARETDLFIVDRIYTRIGASDNIARGESTFMVEMNETAAILNHATHRSLIIMDEIGRGTSTFDGLSIAWAVVEYILRYIKARTLFATHYHELTKLESRKGIVNYTVMVKEHLSGVDFLHKVVRGAADRSYGIHVANLAGIPKPIIARAEELLKKLEKGRSAVRMEDEEASEQLALFNASNHLVVQALRQIDPESMTPIQALNELNRLKKLIE